MQKKRISFGSILFYTAMGVFAASLMFAAVQGESGLFRRVQMQAEADQLRAQRDALAAELASLENLTRRLSDSYLDLDLLDEQLRDILGYVRPEDVVLE